MKVNITDSLKIESEIPFAFVEEFHFEWEPNQHALFCLKGYMDSGAHYEAKKVYGSKVKVWQKKGEKDQILFFGYLLKAEIFADGNTKQVQLQAVSGSYRLDQQEKSQSFQNVGESYAQIIKSVVENDGGKIICMAGTESKIGRPIIRYEETAWELGKRLASHLGTCVLPDIVTGGKKIWFGLRAGSEISDFAEDEFTIEKRRNVHTGKMETSYEVESRKFHKVGDKAVFCGKETIIWKVEASFTRGELVFRYLLREKYDYEMIYQDKFTGLGLLGTVLETKQEQVRIALDIDGGKSTGDYFYNYYPETGNALYAMPEVGVRILLYFGSRDEREGFVMHCMPKATKRDWHYENRYFNTRENNSVHLYHHEIDFSHKGGKNVRLSNSVASAGSSGQLSITAQTGVKFNANRIVVHTPEELNICQG